MKKSPSNGLRGHGRDQRIWLNTHIHRCPWCQGSRSLSHVELYPLLGAPLVCVVSHAGCGPDWGYAMSMKELADDPNDWFWHLTTKGWITKSQAKDIIWDVFIVHKRAWPGVHDRFTAGKYQTGRDGHAAQG